MKLRQTLLVSFLVLLPATAQFGAAAELVTPDNFIRAESDYYFRKKVDDGMFGKIVHVREPASIDRQSIVRMNRDTLYSFGVSDLTQPVTIVKPDTGKVDAACGNAETLTTFDNREL